MHAWERGRRGNDPGQRHGYMPWRTPGYLGDPGDTGCAALGGRQAEERIVYEDLRDPKLSLDAISYGSSEGVFLRYQHPLAHRFLEDPQGTFGSWITIREGVHSTITGEGRHAFFADATMRRFLAPRIRYADVSCERTLVQAQQHTGERILLRKTGDRLISAVVHSESTIWAHQNVYVIHPRSGWDVHLIQAFLGSKMMSFLYRAGTLGQRGRVMAQLRITGIRSLPVPKESAVFAWRAELISLSRSLSEVASKEVWEQINTVVYRLYGADESEITEIERWCSDISWGDTS